MKILILIFIAISCSSVWSQNYYRSIATGNWNALATWQQSADNATWVAATVVPGTTNARNVTIQAAHTVTLTAAVSITPQLAGVITVDGVFNISGGNFTIVDGTAAIDFVNNGTVNISATRQLILGTIGFGSQGQISATGTISNAGTISMTVANASLTNNGTLSNSGTITLTGNPSSFTNSNALTNDGTFTVGNANATFSNTGSLTNNGTLTLTSALTATNSGTLTNNGSFIIAILNFSNSGTWTNRQAAPGSLVRYSGTATQTIFEMNYYNLECTNQSKSLTLTGNIFIRNDFTITMSSAVFAVGISGAGNSILITNNLNVTQGILRPAAGVIITGNSGTNTINGIGGVICVNTLGNDCLINQYTSFENWTLSAANAIQYEGLGDQEVEELLPDGSAYGSINIGGTMGVKTLTLTGSMPTIQGNYNVLNPGAGNPTVAMVNGFGVLGIAGNFTMDQSSTFSTASTISLNGVGPANSVILSNTSNARVMNLTGTSLTSQISGFETWNAMSTAFATTVFNFSGTSAFTVEPIPGSGNAYRELNITGNMGTNPLTFTGIVRVQRVFTVSGTYGNVNMAGNTMWFEPLNNNFIDIPLLPYNNIDILPVVGATKGTVKTFFGDFVISGNLNIYAAGVLDLNNLASSVTVNGNTYIEKLATSTEAEKIILNPSSNIVNATSASVYLNQVTINGSGVVRIFRNLFPTATKTSVNIAGDIINTYGIAATDSLILNSEGVVLWLNGSTAKSLSGPATYYVRETTKINNPAGWTFNSNVFMTAPVQRYFDVLQPLSIAAAKNLNSYGTTPATALSHFLSNPSKITVGNFATQVLNWNQLTATIQYVSNTGNNLNDGLTPATAKRNLQNAHAVLAAGGRLVVLNNITDSLYVTKQIIIEGQGKASTTISPIAKAVNCADYLKARNNGIITFGAGSDSSTVKNLKIAHNNQESRSAIMVMPRVKNIVIDNIWIETNGNGMFKSNASYPYDITSFAPSLCASDADNTNFGRYVSQVAAQYYSSFRLKNSDLTVAASTNPLHRSVAGYIVGTNVDSVIIENNNINNSSQSASQCVWVQEVTNVHVRNNTIQGANFNTASDVFGVDVSSLNNRYLNPKVYVKSNTIATGATHQVCFKLCYRPATGHVYAQNNTITTFQNGTRLNMGVGIGVEATLNATIEGNLFNAPATGNFIHVFVDNNYSTAASLGEKTAPSLNIWGNTFNTNATTTAARAIVFRRTELDPTKYYKSINMIGATANVFAQRFLRYVDIERGLFDPAPGVTTIDMSSQNSFPAIETGYDVEDKITHYLDSRRNESETRPVVNFHNKHFYLTAQQSSAAGDVINTTFPICNRSIQDALDLVPTTSNDYWIHADAKTFKSGAEMAGAELEYGASTQIENTINIITPIYFVGRDTFNTRINRHINVNLANPNQQVTQFGCFTFGVDGIGGVKNFTVTQGDWDLNTKVIIFAPVNALLSETVGNTIKDNYAKTVPSGIRGYIQTTRNLNAPSNLNVAGFGAVITSAVNMGSTVIRRGHNEQILPSPQISIFRYFDIHPTTNAGLNATLVFSYDSSERNNRVEANLKQWRNNDPVLISNWAEQMPLANWSLKGGTAGVSSVSFSGIPSFSRWTLAEGEVVLPVSELVFNAQLIDQKVQLNWSTKNEQNLAHFEVERSFDLQNFEYLSTKIANGNNGVSAQYQDWDMQPKKGVSYYRLKLVNVDGSFTYSNIETIVWEDPGFISIYPNPANQQFNIALGNMDENSVLVQLIDIQGKIITNQSFAVNNGLVNIPTDKLSQGMYVVKVTTQKSVLTGRVVINK